MDTNKKCQEKLNEIITSCNFTDYWRLKNPTKLKYTWHSNTKPVIHSRLDYF